MDSEALCPGLAPGKLDHLCHNPSEGMRLCLYGLHMLLTIILVILCLVYKARIPLLLHKTMSCAWSATGDAMCSSWCVSACSPGCKYEHACLHVCLCVRACLRACVNVRAGLCGNAGLLPHACTASSNCRCVGACQHACAKAVTWLKRGIQPQASPSPSGAFLHCPSVPLSSLRTVQTV